MCDMLKLRTLLISGRSPPPTQPLHKPPFNRIKRKVSPFKPFFSFNVGSAGPPLCGYAAVMVVCFLAFVFCFFRCVGEGDYTLLHLTG